MVRKFCKSNVVTIVLNLCYCNCNRNRHNVIIVVIILWSYNQNCNRKCSIGSNRNFNHNRQLHKSASHLEYNIFSIPAHTHSVILEMLPCFFSISHLKFIESHVRGNFRRHGRDKCPSAVLSVTRPLGLKGLWCGHI